MTPAQPSAETVESWKRPLVDLIDDPDIRERVARVCQQRDDAINAATVMSVALRRAEAAHSTPPASDVIERAVAAERERCAEEVERIGEQFGLGERVFAREFSRNLTAAIRRPQKPASDEGCD